MISKKVANVRKALQGVTDNMTFMFGGFGLSGIPENAIAELVKLNVKSPVSLIILNFNVLELYVIEYVAPIVEALFNSNSNSSVRYGL